MKLLITTQVYENYGEVDDPHWKAKGGNDYVVPSIDVNAAAEIAAQVRPQIEQNNDYFYEYVIGWEVVADDYLTEFERSQLEYEGKITYPATEILVDRLAA
jgi:hypothetical protein